MAALSCVRDVPWRGRRSLLARLVIPVQNAGQELPLVDGVVLPTLLSTGTATVISNLTLRVLSYP